MGRESTDAGDWSVRANYWRGDRALGGRLHVGTYGIRFRPHGVERALGGRDEVDVGFSDVRSLAEARRSLRVPRKRLVVRTDEADHFFLVPRLDRVLDRLESATGLRRETEDDASGPTLDRPERDPDDSAAMNLIHSPWSNLAGLAALVGVLLRVGSADSPSTPWVVILGCLVAFQGWATVRAFQRRARVTARRRGARGEE